MTCSRSGILATLATLTLTVGLVALPATAPAAKPPVTDLDTQGLATGASPAIAWAERSGGTTTLHRPDGTTTQIEGRRVTALAPMGSGYMIQTRGRAGRHPAILFMGADGTPGRRSWRSGYGVAVSPQGRAVAFTVKRGGIRVVDSEGDRVLRFPSVDAPGYATPVAVSGEDCREDETSNGCAVLVAHNGRRPRSFVSSSHGITDLLPWKLVGDVEGPWAGGIVKLKDDGSCSTMTRSYKVRWRTCANIVSDISPGKDYVLGTPPYADGFGPGTLDVLDLRTGERVRTWTSTSTVVTSYFDEVWEDDEHVLLTTYQDGRWAVVRLSLDGSMEYAVEPRKGDMFAKPFQLQTR